MASPAMPPSHAQVSQAVAVSAPHLMEAEAERQTNPFRETFHIVEPADRWVSNTFREKRRMLRQTLASFCNKDFRASRLEVFRCIGLGPRVRCSP